IDWVERAARLAQQDQPRLLRGDITRMAEFARLISSAIYGEGRASMLLSPADIDYILTGIGAEEIPREARADVAMLLKDGILLLPPDGKTRASQPITYEFGIRTLARALILKSQPAQAANASPGGAKTGSPAQAKKSYISSQITGLNTYMARPA